MIILWYREARTGVQTVGINASQPGSKIEFALDRLYTGPRASFILQLQHSDGVVVQSSLLNVISDY